MIEVIDHTTCRACSAPVDVLVPAETFDPPRDAPVPMCNACADAALKAAGGEVTSRAR